MPVVCVLSILLNVCLIVLGIWGLQRHVFVIDTPALDTAAVALAAATVALTLIGTIIAIVAFVGYKEIRRNAIEAARKEATKVADRVVRELAPPLISRNVFESITKEDLSNKDAEDLVGTVTENGRG